MSVVSLLNATWMLSCRGEAMAFQRSIRSVARTQNEVLESILRQNQNTEFGRAHHFASIDGPAAFQQRVPLSSYEDYAQAIAKIGQGGAGVLTQELVQLLEPTSGTTGGEKLIPFTATLRRQFGRAVATWMYDLLHNRPALRHGRAYWSISPAVGSIRYTPGGVPIGFDDDAAYLGSATQWLARRVLAAPSSLAKLPEIDAFRYCSLWFLLRAPDLALISVWSPTFLTALLNPLEMWQERLCFDIARGRPEPPTPLPPEMARSLRCGRDDRRAGVLKAIFTSGLSWPEKLGRIWPQLSLISCWADAGAARYVGQIREMFPTVELQPKGLLATEGCVSFPLLGRVAPILAIRSHFFEFGEIDSPHRIHLAHELDRGGHYRVVLTTGGGLYRYQLRDELEVCGFEQQCPLLRFVGKSDCVSDLVGEKLAEPHVRAVLQRLFDAHRLSPLFALVVPVEARPPRYRLYVQLTAALAEARLAEDLETGLSENPQYAYARRLGQLAPAEIAVMGPLPRSGWAIYEQQCMARGMRAGNIKPLALDRWTGWGAVFDPVCRSQPPARSGAR